MDMITVSAKTLDEAITKALIELQITSAHLHYEIIEKGSAGLFGIFGSKPCVIRARIMSEEEEKALQDEADKKEAARAEAARAEKAREEAAKREAAKAEAAKKEAAKREAAKAEAAKKEAAKKEAVKKDPIKKDPVKKDPVKKDPVKQAEAKPIVKANEKFAERPAKAEKRERLLVKVDEAVIQKKAKDFLYQLFDAMAMKVTIETSFDAEEGELQVSMIGDDMGILIGKRGQTLDSLQYLLSLVVNKEAEGYLRVKLDTENYRERRKETLETLAKNISYKVKRTKHSVSLEPMNPYERRIIHSALQNDRYVLTRSEGEDPYRHVVISLKREGYNNNRRDRYPSRQKEKEIEESM